MKKLLILENHPAYQESLRRALDVRPREYEFAVRGSIDEATKAQSLSDVALALVDRRAEDDEDENDDSGLHYAEGLEKAGTKAVLVSAYPQAIEGLFDLLRRGDITGLVDKKVLSAHCLILCAEHFLRFQYFPNGIAAFGLMRDFPCEVTADSSYGLACQERYSAYWKAIEEKLGDGVEKKLGEVEILLRALISPCATKVYLKVNETQGQSGTLVLKAEVTGVDAPVVETLAIKLGARKAILSEKLRYDRFVGPLPDGAATQLRWHAETENLAAIAYSWVDDSVEEGIELRRLVSKENSPAVWRRGSNAVDRLFHTSLHAWHKVYHGDSASKHPTAKESLLKYYLGRGGLWYEGEMSLKDVVKLIAPVDGLVRSEWEWRFLGRNESILPSPIRWLEEYGSSFLIKRASPVHGDLHVRNIFILGDDSPRLIDFGRTDMGHVFRDFASLEASVRIALVSQVLATQFLGDTPSPDKSEAVREEAIGLAILSEEALYAAEHLGDWFDTSAPQSSRMGVVFSECLQLTLAIRRAARDACRTRMTTNGFAEYLFALGMHLLRYAADVADELSDEVREQTKPFRVWQASYAAARAVEKAEFLTASTNASDSPTAEAVPTG